MPVKKIEVNDDNDGRRLDNYLLSIYQDVPKSKIYSIIRKGEVRVNSGRVKPHTKIKTNDVIRIPPYLVNDSSMEKKPVFSESLINLIKTNIIYEDSNYLILNNDTVVGKDWLFPLIKPLILNNYSCGSPITNNCGNEIKQFIKYDNPNDLLKKGELLQKYKNYKCVEIDRIPFFCPVVRKKDFYSVGMLDVKYKVGGWEDDDLLETLGTYALKVKAVLPESFTEGDFTYNAWVNSWFGTIFSKEL